MKQHLVNLLFEEYQQHQLVKQLQPLIQDIAEVSTCIYRTVVDMVGFPKDAPAGPPIRDGRFRRDWLYEEYFDVVYNLSKKHSVFSGIGLDLNDKFDEAMVKEALGKYIDWLYQEFESYKGNIKG